MTQDPAENQHPQSPDIDEVEEDATEQDVEHYHFTIAKNLTRRIDQYLTDRISHLSRSGVQRLIDEGLVKVNGKVLAKASYHPREGDKIEMVAPPEPISQLIPEPIPLDIIYEDEHFLALNKQANLMVHPARGVWTGTLVNGLVHYAQKWSQLGGNWRPGILHRLDRNTTGVMLVARSDEAHWRLARQFENRTIQKTYLALCHGIPQLQADVIDLPIGRDRYTREKQAIRKIENGGKPATTTYHLLESFHTPHGQFAFLKLTPKTGRTHQLRVHMAAINHPLVGDTMYGGQIFEHQTFRFDRQALHAHQITFTHPGTQTPITLTAPLPPDLSQLIEILRSPTPKD